MHIEVGGLTAANAEAPRPPEKKLPRKPLPDNVLVLDNTRLGAFKTSPRYFYYRHIRGWVRDTDFPIAMVGGACWSLAMDAIWPLVCLTADGGAPEGAGLNDQEITDAGWDAFCQGWMSHGLTHPSEIGAEQYREYGANAPGVYNDMLLHYVRQRREWLSSIRLLGVEVPMVVRIPKGRGVIRGKQLYYGARIDKVCADIDGYFWADHKTTRLGAKGGGGFRSSWVEKWNPNSQADGYCHAGEQGFGDAFWGGLIDAALCNRDHHDCFEIIPIDQELAMLGAWKAQVAYWSKLLLQEVQRLDKIRTNVAMGIPHTRWLEAFPCDGSSCDGYGTCQYRGLCQTHPNPEATLHECPDGYIEDQWEPFEGVDHDAFGADELKAAMRFHRTGEV